MCSPLTTSTARAFVKADVLSPGVLMAARELPALSCLGFCSFVSVWRDDLQDPQEEVDSHLTSYMELFYETIKARANHCLLSFLSPLTVLPVSFCSSSNAQRHNTFSWFIKSNAFFFLSSLGVPFTGFLFIISFEGVNANLK